MKAGPLKTSPSHTLGQRLDFLLRASGKAAGGGCLPPRCAGKRFGRSAQDGGRCERNDACACKNPEFPL